MTVDDVLAYPHQIGDALWRVGAAGIPARSARVEVCGVAYGADALAAAIVGDRARGPAAGEEPLVLCVSYSGDDEEALECFDEAGRRGVPRAVVCTAGALAAHARDEGVPVIGVPAGFDDPRAAIVYFTVAAVVSAEPSLAAELEAAIPTLERLAAGEPAEAETPAERVLVDLFRRDLESAKP
jgi:hypothetical protein